MAEDSHTITGLLEEWRSGNQDAANRIMELVYSELHRIASREMRREHGEHTLQTTAVVHEVYLRLCGTAPINWKDRSHFFAVAAGELRRVLVDHARRGRVVDVQVGGHEGPGVGRRAGPRRAYVLWRVIH